MHKLGISKIKNLIKNTGLFNSKAKNVFLLSKNKLKNLILLSLITLINWLVYLIAFDTHFYRPENKIGLAKGKNVLDVENNYLKIIPNWAIKDAHHWFIFYGRYVCKAKNPECNICKIKEFCEFFKKEIYYG